MYTQRRLLVRSIFQHQFCADKETLNEFGSGLRQTRIVHIVS